MKKLLLTAITLLGLTGLVKAGPPWVSSHTATADTAQKLCTQGGEQRRRGVFHGLCVNDNPAGQITVYNSSATAANPVLVVRSTSAIVTGCSFYDIYMTSGIVYSKTAADDVTFMFDCY